MPAGTLMVRTAQPLGTLAVYLLEPRSEDGLATWNFFDAELKQGGDFPVSRLLQAGPDLARRPPSRSPRTAARCGRSRSSTAGGRRGRGRGGGFAGQPRWLDGEHWLQVRDGRLMKVHAATGRSQPFVDAKALAKGLARIPLARPGSRPVDRRPDVLRHGPGQAGLPVRARTGPLLRHVRRLNGGPPDQPPRPRAVAPVQSRRQVRRVRPRFRPVRRRHRQPDRTPPDHRRARRPAARTCRLGLLRGDLQPPLAGVLVEPRLEAARLHGV